MQSNLEKALTEQPNRGSRNRAEQRAIWQRKLRKELDCEKRDIDFVEQELEYLVVFEEEIVRYNDLQHTLERRDAFIGYLFSSMHRVAYFDGILGGTGISKDANETPPDC